MEFLCRLRVDREAKEIPEKEKSSTNRVRRGSIGAAAEYAQIYARCGVVGRLLPEAKAPGALIKRRTIGRHWRRATCKGVGAV